MKTITKLWAALLLTFVLTLSVVAKDNKSVERGMTKQQVTEIYGKPVTKSFDEASETWIYEKSRGGLLGYMVRIVVGFDADGLVAKCSETKLESPNRDVPPPGDARYVRRNVRAVSSDGFAVIMKKVRGASFSSGKLDLIEVAAIGGYFTCSQCSQMLSAFSFASDKMKALELVSYHIVDPENASAVYSQFTFSSDKDKAAQLIRNAARR